MADATTPAPRDNSALILAGISAAGTLLLALVAVLAKVKKCRGCCNSKCTTVSDDTLTTVPSIVGTTDSGEAPVTPVAAAPAAAAGSSND